MGKFMWAIAFVFGWNVTVVRAQEPAQGPEPATAYAFEDDLVRGDTLGPNLEVLTTRRRGARSSLIRTREHFIDRLLTSVENL